jgi:hypothetical protein
VTLRPTVLVVKSTMVAGGSVIGGEGGFDGVRPFTLLLSDRARGRSSTLLGVTLPWWWKLVCGV